MPPKIARISGPFLCCVVKIACYAHFEPSPPFPHSVGNWAPVYDGVYVCLFETKAVLCDMPWQVQGRKKKELPECEVFLFSLSLLTWPLLSWGQWGDAPVIPKYKTRKPRLSQESIEGYFLRTIGTFNWQEQADQAVKIQKSYRAAKVSIVLRRGKGVIAFLYLTLSRSIPPRWYRIEY